MKFETVKDNLAPWPHASQQDVRLSNRLLKNVARVAEARQNEWSPYVVGFFIGVLSWASFLLSDKPIGVSTAYARTSGMLEEMISGPYVKEREYYQKYVPKRTRFLGE